MACGPDAFAYPDRLFETAANFIQQIANHSPAMVIHQTTNIRTTNITVDFVQLSQLGGWIGEPVPCYGMGTAVVV